MGVFQWHCMAFSRRRSSSCQTTSKPPVRTLRSELPGPYVSEMNTSSPTTTGMLALTLSSTRARHG